MRQAIDNNDIEISVDAHSLKNSRVFHMTISFYLGANDSDSEAERNMKFWGIEPCNKKPDCSNMLKFYEDAANEVLFPDDCMIVSGDFKKEYDEIPRTEIEIMSKKELELDEKTKSVLKVFSPDILKEFLVDVGTFKEIFIEKICTIDSDDRSVFLASAATMLSDFAIKYADILKKIKNKTNGE